MAANRNFSYEGSIASDRDIHQKKEGNFTPAFRFLPMKRAPHEDIGTSNRGLTVPLELEVLNDEHCTFPAVYVLSSRPVTSVM